MKEFLIIGNTVEIKQIDSADICYILASKNSSYIYLTNGERIHVLMQIGKIYKKIQSSLETYKDFYKIGRSLIVNRTNLSAMNVSEQQLIFSDKRSEAYLKGYTAGYSDGYSDSRLGKPSRLPLDLGVGQMILKYEPGDDDQEPELDKIHLPKKHLKELLKRLQEGIINNKNKE
ncbi:MAG: LytTR family transcriptional regulator DNA-binding domain-containing protein [Bacteroidales bacterium]|nr:LytTR family transcriptional regulator DNA-binding domain-containing protein [Bacteroidales bacterium]